MVRSHTVLSNVKKPNTRFTTVAKEVAGCFFIASAFCLRRSDRRRPLSFRLIRVGIHISSDEDDGASGLAGALVSNIAVLFSPNRTDLS